MSSFERALDVVLKHEGGYVNDPRDPGGATNFGVTQRTYNAFRARRGLPFKAVYNIDRAEVVEIYRGSYWNAIRGDELPFAIAYTVFDGAVHSGPAQSIKWLQRTLRMKDADGIIGDITLRALRAVSDHRAVINGILDRRHEFLKRLRVYKSFPNGLDNRVKAVRRQALAWAGGAVLPVATISDKGAAVLPVGFPAKARAEDAVSRPSPSMGDATIGAGTASGGVALALLQAREAVEPLSGGGGVIDGLIVGLAVGAALATIAGIAVRMWSAKRAAEYDEALR